MAVSVGRRVTIQFHSSTYHGLPYLRSRVLLHNPQNVILRNLSPVKFPINEAFTWKSLFTFVRHICQEMKVFRNTRTPIMRGWAGDWRTSVAALISHFAHCVKKSTIWSVHSSLSHFVSSHFFTSSQNTTCGHEWPQVATGGHQRPFPIFLVFLRNFPLVEEWWQGRFCPVFPSFFLVQDRLVFPSHDNTRG